MAFEDFVKTYGGFATTLAAGGLAGAIFTQLVTFWRRPKSVLTYGTTQTNIVTASHSRLTVQFDGSAITRLDSHLFLIVNSGNQALKNLAVRFEVPHAGSIVEHAVIGFDGFAHSIAASQSFLTVTFELLNPGERFSATISTADMTTGTEMLVIARAENLVVRRETLVPSGLRGTDLLAALLRATWGDALGNALGRVLKI